MRSTRKIQFIICIVGVAFGFFIFSVYEKIQGNSVSGDQSVKAISSGPINVSIKAGDVNYALSVANNSSVYDVMLDVASTTPFAFKSKEYSGLGFLIEEINGIKNANGTYWTLYINDEYSTVGASQYRLKTGDKVEWKYEKR